MRSALSKPKRNRTRGPRARGLADRVDLVIGDLPFEPAKSREAEPVLAHQRVDLVDAVELDLAPQRVVIVAPLQGEDDRLRHAGLTGPRREPEVQSELYRPRHFDDPAVDDEDVAASIVDQPGDVSWPRH